MLVWRGIPAERNTMSNDVHLTISRAKLQAHIDSAIDGAISEVGGSLTDPEFVNKLLRCLMRRMVRDLRVLAKTAHPATLLTMLRAVATDTIQSMLKHGELSGPPAPELITFIPNGSSNN